MDLVDFSTLESVSGGDKKYFSDVIDIFIDTTTKAVEKLKALAKTDDDHLEISAIAHSIKSGVGIVKIKGMLEELIQVEKLAKDRANMDAVRIHLQKAAILYEKSLPILLKEKKNKAANK